MSEKSKVTSKLLGSRASREAYIGAKLKFLIPSQIRGLRLKSATPRQEDLANAADMKQSRISAMETPGEVNFNLETLVRIAAALKVGLVVKFVSFTEMLRWDNDFSQDDFEVVSLDKDRAFTCEAVRASATLEAGARVTGAAGNIANETVYVREATRANSIAPFNAGFLAQLSASDSYLGT